MSLEVWKAVSICGRIVLYIWLVCIIKLSFPSQAVYCKRNGCAHSQLLKYSDIDKVRPSQKIMKGRIWQVHFSEYPEKHVLDDA